MMNKRLAFAAAALLLSGMHAPALAQAKGKAAAKAPAPAAARAALSKDQQEHAVQNFAIMASAMRSDKIGDDVKSALMSCIYSNSLEKISTAIDKAIADNPGKVDRTKPDDLLSVMVAVCGYRPSATANAGQGAAPAGPPATPPAGAPTGR